MIMAHWCAESNPEREVREPHSQENYMVSWGRILQGVNENVFMIKTGRERKS